MKPFIFGARHGIHIINLEETQTTLEKACAFLRQTAARGGIILFVGTKKHAAAIVEAAATRAGMPFVNRRWLGGTLTNFAVIHQVIKKFKDLLRRQEQGEFAKYTKFEQMKLGEEIEGLVESVGGIRDLTRIPDAVFILDIRRDKTALREAQRRGVKIVALCDTNVDPTQVDYAVPANDDAIKSIELLTNIVADACLEGRKEWEAARARLGSSLTTKSKDNE
jgi:small subunit ribosomal protein S2